MKPPRVLSLEPAPGASAAPQKFEDNLARLEQIVADMENADLPLEKLLATYEEGMRLVKDCGDRLADAEQKVEILSRTMNAAPVSTAPAAATPTETAAAPADEIRLF